MTFTKIVNTGIGTLVHSFAVPKGLTSERPIGISSGQIRYNTDLHIFEGYHNNVWQSLSSASAEQIYKETFNVVNAQSSFTLSSCLLYTSPSPRDQRGSRMPSSA